MTVAIRRYDNYIFDLYGTLVDIHTDETLPRLWRATAAEYARRGALYGPRELRGAYLAAVARLEEGEPLREIDLAQVFAALYRDRGVTPTDTLVAGTAWAFRRASTTHLRLYAGGAGLLDSLRRAGGRVFLLSNAQRIFTAPELELLGLAGRFDGILLSSDVGWRKPSPRFFRALTDQYALDPGRCLMIGNDPDCDIAGAAQAGMDSWYIHSALSPRVAHPEAVPATYRQVGMDLNALTRRLLGGLS